MASKNPLDALYRIAAFSSNIGRGLLSTKLIGGNFLKDSLFKLASDFRLSTGVRSINKVAVKDKRIGFRMLATIKGPFNNILQQLALYLSNAFNILKGCSYSLYSQGLSPSCELKEPYS
jgi:hypothetical protein